MRERASQWTSINRGRRKISYGHGISTTVAQKSCVDRSARTVTASLWYPAACATSVVARRRRQRLLLTLLKFGPKVFHLFVQRVELADNITDGFLAPLLDLLSLLSKPFEKG